MLILDICVVVTVVCPPPPTLHLYPYGNWATSRSHPFIAPTTVRTEPTDCANHSQSFVSRFSLTVVGTISD